MQRDAVQALLAPSELLRFFQTRALLEAEAAALTSAAHAHATASSHAVAIAGGACALDLTQSRQTRLL
jgi:hypothetical protein